MVKFLFLITLLPVLTFGADYDLIKCEGSTLPLEFGINECPNGSPCTFKIGQTVTIHGKVQVGRPELTATFFVDVIKSDEKVINLLTTDACSVIDKPCPVDIGPVGYSVPVEIKDVPTGEKVILKLFARDENNYVVACVSLPAVFS